MDMSVTRHPSAANTPVFSSKDKYLFCLGVWQLKLPVKNVTCQFKTPFFTVRWSVTPLVMSSDAMMVP